MYVAIGSKDNGVEAPGCRLLKIITELAGCFELAPVLVYISNEPQSELEVPVRLRAQTLDQIYHLFASAVLALDLLSVEFPSGVPTFVKLSNGEEAIEASGPFSPNVCDLRGQLEVVLW